MDRVLGKRLTKAVGPSGSVTYVWAVSHCQPTICPPGNNDDAISVFNV